MIELHSHLLPGIDDGSNSFEESVNIINKMKDLGYSKIVITPHYINGTKYNSTNQEKYALLLQLQSLLKSNNIDIELYLGNEIFIDDNILSLIKNGECCTINSSKYVFIELSRNDEILNLNEIVFELEKKNIIPILAHPERYVFLQKDYSKLNDLIDRNILLQVNFESINGKYGREAKKLAKYIFKNNMADFIGGDVHHENSVFFDTFEKNKKKIIKLIGEDIFNELIDTNPQLVLDNKEIIKN